MRNFFLLIIGIMPICLIRYRLYGSIKFGFCRINVVRRNIKRKRNIRCLPGRRICIFICCLNPEKLRMVIDYGGKRIFQIGCRNFFRKRKISYHRIRICVNLAVNRFFEHHSASHNMDKIPRQRRALLLSRLC